MDYLATRKDIELALIRKAREDKNFEQLLFSDPEAALKSVGVVLPQEFDLKVVQEKKGELILVYPASTAQEELSELELASAAGGSAGNVSPYNPTGGANL